MSTRAVYTFIDSTDTFHVYKHHDGYPAWAAKSIEKAKDKAWEFPRFEADEFAASFVAANKDGEGGVRIAHNFEQGDLEYRYEIKSNEKTEPVVTAFERTTGDKWKEIWSGKFSKLGELAALEIA